MYNYHKHKTFQLEFKDNLAIKTHSFYFKKSGCCNICLKNDRKKDKLYCCSNCHFNAHESCISRIKIFCKHYCTDDKIIKRSFNSQISTESKSSGKAPSIDNDISYQKLVHHWIYSIKQRYSCQQCNIKFSIQPGYICSWCKKTVHMNAKCSNKILTYGICDLGVLRKFIILPFPEQFDVNSPILLQDNVSPFNTRHSETVNILTSIDNSSMDSTHDDSTHISNNVIISSSKTSETMLNSITSSPILPILVFVNPKSGGNHGFKILKKFKWFLNPQQVFDLSQINWKEKLKRFEYYPYLHFLVCGGDGTVCWILSVIDEMNFISTPSISIIPLGTGNDLSITLGWGSKYKPFDVVRFLKELDLAKKVLIDRWFIKVDPLNNEDNSSIYKQSFTRLFQNYFSIGSDAEIALSFHKWRENKKSLKSSRIRNKVYYAQEGSKVLTTNTDISRKISKFICDGIDCKEQLDAFKPCSILLLNISSYGGGTAPWGSSNGDSKFTSPRCDDKIVEILLFSNFDMIKVQLGSHAKRFLQCSNVTIQLNSSVTMQYDGEPEALEPSFISIGLKNQAIFLKRSKKKIC